VPPCADETDFSPFFPPELEREISKTTAYNYPEMTAKLVPVSQRAHD
jgi:hypothetical protein